MDFETPQINRAMSTFKFSFAKSPTESSNSLPRLHPVFEHISNQTSPITTDESIGSITNQIHDSRVQPPPDKQLLDILALLKSSKNLDTINLDGELSEGDYVFLISKDWFMKWRKFCESNGVSPYPDEINNWPMIDISPEATKTPYNFKECKFRLKQSLRENKHFFVLTGEMWEALHCWYGGGPPLPRKVLLDDLDSAPMRSPRDTDETRLYIDYYPEIINCFSDAIHRPHPHHTVGETAFTPVPPHDRQIKNISDLNDSNLNTTTTTTTADSIITTSNKAALTSSNNNNNGVTQNKCFTCGLNAPVHCSKCRAIHYCGVDCQKVSLQFFHFTSFIHIFTHIYFKRQLKLHILLYIRNYHIY